MTKEKEYNPCVNPLIFDTLNEIGVGSFRSESYIASDPDKPENGYHLILNGLHTKNKNGIFNVPLNSAQVKKLMDVIPNNVHFLNFGFNSFNDDVLKVILNSIKEKGMVIKNLGLEMNNFSDASVEWLKEFNNSNPGCKVYTDQYSYSEQLFNYENFEPLQPGAIGSSDNLNITNNNMFDDKNLIGNCNNYEAVENLFK